MESKKVLSIALLVLLGICSQSYAFDLTLNDAPVKVFFSPNGGCTRAIVDAINNAKSEVLVQAYHFNSDPIAEALVAAKERGVTVEVILDKRQRKHKFTASLASQGLTIYIDDAHAIAHDKIMILDRVTVITGSFNFTKPAEERNAENLLILKSEDLAKLYTDNWKKHKEHSDLYEPKS